VDDAVSSLNRYACAPPARMMTSASAFPDPVLKGGNSSAALLGNFWRAPKLGSQTQTFHPTDYVDITSVREKKRTALFAHRSQNGEEIYRKHHQIMEDFRGREFGVPAAEAFVRLARPGPAEHLPGL